METTLRVRLLNREYPLRVHEADADRTLALVAYVEEKLQAFQAAHPQQPELTTAVITALALAEELFAVRESVDALERTFDAELATLDARLGEALDAPPRPAARQASEGVPADR